MLGATYSFLTASWFSVSGALHAPISIFVLLTAQCIAARAYGCALLWLDRLCIMQSSKADKNSQIQIELTLMLVGRYGYELYHRVGMEREVNERKTKD